MAGPAKRRAQSSRKVPPDMTSLLADPQTRDFLEAYLKITDEKLRMHLRQMIEMMAAQTQVADELPPH